MDNFNDDKCIKCRGRGKWKIVGKELQEILDELGLNGDDVLVNNIQKACLLCGQTGSETTRKLLIILNSEPELHAYSYNCPSVNECELCGMPRKEHTGKFKL